MKKLGLVGGFALATVAIAGGCKGRTVEISRSRSGELVNGLFPGSEIVTNNLAQDRGGFSNNDQTASVDDVKCTFNNRLPDSDSPNSSADGSAMILFSVRNNSDDVQRVYASYWSGSAFTPPTELTGADRHESIKLTAGPNGGPTLKVHVSAATLIPLNTSGYKSPGSTTGTADQVVRANSGNWLLLWDAETASQSPSLVTGDTINNSVGAADANGVHHTFYATVFLKSLASQATATSERVGNTQTTGAAVSSLPAESKVFHFGFQAVGIEVPGTGLTAPGTQNRGGASRAYSDFGFLNTNGATRTGGLDRRYAEDVISFGAATDTFVGCAKFVGASNNSTSASLGLDRSGLQNPGNKYLYEEWNPGATSVTNWPALDDTGALAPGSSDYACGDDTSFVQLFWTQLVTSHAGANSTAFNVAPGNPAEIHLGPGYRFFTANFDLASMTVKNQKTVAFTQTRNTTTGGSFGATQALPGFVTYNNTVFWRYRDASLAVGFTNAADTAKLADSAGVSVNVSLVMACLTVKPATNGTADIDQTGQLDVTRHGSAGKHSVANRTAPGSGGSEPGNEIVSFPCTDCQVIGPDEGMADLTAFVLGRSTTNTSGTDNDADVQLWCLAVNPATGVPIGTASGGNPRRVSKHLTEPFTGAGYVPGASGGTDSILHDDVGDLKLSPARDGSYVVIGYRQPQGASSLNQNLGLMATVYKTLRAASATVSSGSGTTAVSTTLDQRFPTTDPIQVNTPSLTAYANVNGLVQGINNNTGFTGSPVAAYEFQGGLDYKCGFQSAADKVSVLWLHADGSEERAFIRQLTITKGTSATTNPTIAATGTESELESGNLVQGAGAYSSFDTPTGDSTIRITGSQYRFVPYSNGVTVPSVANTAQIYTGGGPGDTVDVQGNHLPTDAAPYRPFGVNCSSLANFKSIDAGSSGGAGDVLVVFSKITDATTTDGDFFDQGIFAVRYTGANVTDRAAIGSNLNENRNTLGALKSSVAALVGTPKSASLTTSQLSTAGGAYVLMTVPVNDSGTSPSMVVARHFRPLSGTGTSPTFANLFFPAAGATTADATFAEPVQLSRLLNSDAKVEEIFTSGRSLLVLIRQDNHFWGSVTSDGESYTSNGGAPAPFLADDNTSAKTPGNKIQEASCRKISSSCDDRSGSILAIVKQDANLNARIYIRVLQ